MMVRTVGWILAFTLVPSAAVRASAPTPIPHLYATPSVGAWRWDDQALPGFTVKDRTAFVFGGRVGFAPIEAFSAELVALTGTNDAKPEGGGEPVSVRLSQVELSFLVNFQALVSSPVYPYLDLGAGVSVRRGGDEPDNLNNSHFAFHIGGGLKAALDPRLALRFNVRDTFFTETRAVGNQETQATVDSVELSLGLEYRLPVGRSGGPRRLR